MARKLPTYLAERIKFPENRNAKRRECWRWIGPAHKTGRDAAHGYAYYEGRRITARKAVYIHLRGEPDAPLKPGVCGMDWCVNPWHMLTEEPPIPGDHPHGDPSTYGNYGCRCRPCKDANAAARRASPSG